MERAEISRLAHVDHVVAAPVSEARVAQLVGALSVAPGGSVLDLGCGQGAWLLAVAAAHPDVRCIGVDVSRPALREADAAAGRLGLRDAVEWVEADAAVWSEGRHDVVLCIGASHVFGGLDGTLEGVRARLKPAGQVLLGDGIWHGPPTEAAQKALQAGADDYPDLAGLVGTAQSRGFEVINGHVSTLEEWDDYEWAWTGSLIRWAIEQPQGSEDAAFALAAAREHRDDWLSGYREQLGFVTLHLADLRTLAVRR